MKKKNNKPELQVRQWGRRWRWRLLDRSGAPLATPTRNFATRRGAFNNFEQVRLAMDQCTIIE
jgi:hypothetical protein